MVEQRDVQRRPEQNQNQTDQAPGRQIGPAGQNSGLEPCDQSEAQEQKIGEKLDQLVQDDGGRGARIGQAARTQMKDLQRFASDLRAEREIADSEDRQAHSHERKKFYVTV